MIKKSYLVSSLILVFLIVITACFGLLVPTTYNRETANWIAQCMAQDWIDLVLGAPILLISAIAAYRKSIIGYIVWLGSLFFVIYSYLIFAFMVHFNTMFLAYVAILGVSIFLSIFVLLSTDFSTITKNFSDNWSRKTTAYLLITLGVLFYLFWLKDIISAQVSGIIPKSMVEAGLITNAVYVIDLAVCLPFLILSGYYLLKQRVFGAVLAGSALVFSTLMLANITFIIYFVGYRGLPTDYSVAIIFGAIGVFAAVVCAKYLHSFK